MQRYASRTGVIMPVLENTERRAMLEEDDNGRKLMKLLAKVDGVGGMIGVR
jgi:hypothetical protein